MNFQLLRIILIVFSLSLFDVVPSFACKKTYTLEEGIPFAKQVASNVAKTYVIRSRFDLSHEEVLLPRGCVLLFENGGMVVGGKLSGFFLNGQKENVGQDFCQLEFQNTTLDNVFFNDINVQSFSFKNCKIKNVDSMYQVVKKVSMLNCEFEDVRGTKTSGFSSAELSLNNTDAQITKYVVSWVKSKIKASKSSVMLKVIGDKDKAVIETDAGYLETNLAAKQIVAKSKTKVVRIK